MRRSWKQTQSCSKTESSRQARPAFRAGFLGRFMLSIAALVWGACTSQAQIVVTDITGREVEIAVPAKRVPSASPVDYSTLSMLKLDGRNSLQKFIAKPGLRDLSAAVPAESTQSTSSSHCRP